MKSQVLAMLGLAKMVNRSPNSSSLQSLVSTRPDAHPMRTFTSLIRPGANSSTESAKVVEAPAVQNSYL
jgi:hypothetical protein